jgi:hypothetical protein
MASAQIARGVTSPCGIGLFLTLIGIKAYGLDLSAAFFRYRQ